MYVTLMEQLSIQEIKYLDTSESFTNVFREQVGKLLELDLSDTADLPMSGITPGRNIFAESLTHFVPENIYANVFSNGSFSPWVYRFGFTPRALNTYALNYDRVHGDNTFPKNKFIEEIRRAKNRAYKHKSRTKFKTSALYFPDPDTIA